MVEPAVSFCLVVYDVVDDRVRHHISEACLDFGLERFQMSAFGGNLSAPRRKELFVRMCDLLGAKPGRLLVQPIGGEDLQKRFVLHQKGQPSEGEEGTRHREFPEPGHEKSTILKF